MPNRNLIGREHLFRTGGCVLIVGALTAIPLAISTSVADAQSLDVPGVSNLEAQHAPSLSSVLFDEIRPYITHAPLPISGTAPQVPPIDQSGIGALPLAAATHGQQALVAAESKIGAPYVWGATGPDSFDCSGLAQWSYKQAGVSIPRTTYEQVDGGTPVAEVDLQSGDLVLFYGGEHVGLYAGNGEVVHAPTSGQTVQRARLDSMPFYAARRY
ncbi:C40 family peptidase [Rhodococcus globerulus]|uniref:C40 family peptidase n=1 Tax=Rhodococcus globerulus TaxID=33008 RepID=A0ABU4C624_RHOGO|nr:C40 family peptidase [Rhodococcus globerulus]MDV6271818.1 C40 family peptidase [Rhodococcus globerulus]